MPPEGRDTTHLSPYPRGRMERHGRGDGGGRPFAPRARGDAPPVASRGQLASTQTAYARSVIVPSVLSLKSRKLTDHVEELTDGIEANISV